MYNGIYPVVKKREIVRSAGKCVEPERIILSVVT